MRPRILVKPLAGFVIFAFLLITGCATIEQAPQSDRSVARTSEGVYHIVKKGQTLYQIAKLYQIDVDTIVTANAIMDCSKIEIGQKLFIPYRLEAKELEAVASDFAWPANGKIVFGFGSVLDNSPNKGIALRPYADMDVRAAKTGRVVLIHPALKGYGKAIIISHEDNFYTVYANLSQILVTQNQDVYKGAVIAKLANSEGVGPTLHFEIRKGGYAQNPLYFLPLR